DARNRGAGPLPQAFDERPQETEGGRCRVGGRVEDGERGLAPEPGRLASRELLVVQRVELDRRVQRQLAVEGRPALAVADGGERAEPGIPSVAQGPRLFDEAGVELRTGACGDPATELRGGHHELEAEDGRRVR